MIIVEDHKMAKSPRHDWISSMTEGVMERGSKLEWLK